MKCAISNGALRALLTVPNFFMLKKRLSIRVMGEKVLWSEHNRFYSLFWLKKKSISSRGLWCKDERNRKKCVEIPPFFARAKSVWRLAVAWLGTGIDSRAVSSLVTKWVRCERTFAQQTVYKIGKSREKHWFFASLRSDGVAVVATNQQS